MWPVPNRRRCWRSGWRGSAKGRIPAWHTNGNCEAVYAILSARKKEPLPKDVMKTIVIQYFEQTKDLASGSVILARLGEEIFDSISEALLPGHGNHRVFCVKKFTSSTHYRWHVEEVALSSQVGTVPAVYTVTLSKLFSSNVPEVYLRQTLDKTRQSLESLIRPGTLVDVDYGFIQIIAREDGEMRTNKRYCDTLQKGEMHKRRLAVVVRAKRGIVQVAPVTSQAPAAADKTCFQLSKSILIQLAQWGTSGKDSWVLTGMIESISISRILPPVTAFKKAGQTRHGRNPNYSLRLTAQETADMKICLGHSVGLVDYQQTKIRLAESQQSLSVLPDLTAELATLKARLAVLADENRQLRLVEEIAQGWSKHMGTNALEDEVADLKAYYDELDAQVPAAANDAVVS